MRVLIAVPTFETIAPDTFKAIWDMDRPCDCDFEFVRGYDCATARNRIAQKSIDGGYDFVLMVDSDITPQADALACLLEHDVDMVSGFYLHRSLNGDGTDRADVFKLTAPDGSAHFNYTSESRYEVGEIAELRESGENLVEIHGCGMGISLVRTSVFGNVKFPWFSWINYPGAARNLLSEDLFFCEALRKAGIPRYMDTRVGCGHLFRRIEEAM